MNARQDDPDADRVGPIEPFDHEDWDGLERPLDAKSMAKIAAMRSRTDQALPEIVAALRLDAQMREACLKTIRFRIPYLEARSDFHAKTPAAGAVKQQAKLWPARCGGRRRCRRARAPFRHRLWGERRRCRRLLSGILNRAIATANYLSVGLSVRMEVNGATLTSFWPKALHASL